MDRHRRTHRAVYKPRPLSSTGVYAQPFLSCPSWYRAGPELPCAVSTYTDKASSQPFGLQLLGRRQFCCPGSAQGRDNVASPRVQHVAIWWPHAATGDLWLSLGSGPSLLQAWLCLPSKMQGHECGATPMHAPSPTISWYERRRTCDQSEHIAFVTFCECSAATLLHCTAQLPNNITSLCCWLLSVCLSGQRIIQCGGTGGCVF